MDSPKFYALLCAHAKADCPSSLQRALVRNGFATTTTTTRNWRDGNSSPTLDTVTRACEAVGLQITITPKQQSNEPPIQS